MRQTTLILITLLASIMTSLPVLAAWQLDNEKSQLTFMSVKKSMIAENHHFSTLAGNIDEKAQVNINVDLASVNTNIVIRDERMKQFVFESNKYASATFSAQLDNTMLAALKTGDVKQLTVDGQIDFHGQQQAVSINVNVIKLTEKQMLVHTSQPFFIKAEAFSLVAGINKLKELASLPSIDYVVPVSFSVTFVR
ncbi:YceI family protein [Colwellia sp. M166]|uniref:YceI family protein n=1 Tax=Colwellia sp. M166 TaxID=2583805 RepID=UPI00211E399F|nr:YceI family protein [Colwellia sp. M166]|tara:strand:- start:1330 stop:1914 length:585 start_codon:yes stop_codon:yes gene_type:complete